jgi:hypothetical protein
MQAITTIGLDIAKSVFQVHGVDAAGQMIIRRQLKRRLVLAFFQKLPPCLVEAPLTYRNAMLQEKAADLIDHSRSLADQARSHPVQCL